MYVCMRASVFVCAHVWICLTEGERLCVCVCVCVCVCKCICECMCTNVQCVCVFTDLGIMRVWAFLCKYEFKFVSKLEEVCVRVCVHILIMQENKPKIKI